MAGGRNKKNFNKSKPRKPKKPSLFVEGGLLSDWSPVINPPSSQGKSNNSNNTGNKLNTSKNKSAMRFDIGSSSGGKSKASSSTSRIIDSQKPKMNAFAYRYPQVSPLPDKGGDGHNILDESHPVVLVDTKESKIVAYMDNTQVIDSETVIYTYDYSAGFEVDDSSSHRGLGFHDEQEENPSVTEASPFTEKKESSRFDSSSSEEMETDMMGDDASDIEGSSSPEENSGFLSIGGMKLYTRDLSCEEDDEDNEDDEESIDSSESEGSSNLCDSDGLYNGDSDIDDEIAKDYFEGIGGSFDVASVDRLVGQVLDSSDDDDEDDITGGCVSETLKRLGGIALQDASREYGMKKPHSRRKSRVKPSNVGAAKLPHSWPSRAEKSKNFRRFPGEKKKQRQDMIALKRRERMIRRGDDLDQINLKLEQMVQNGGDIMSFQLMHSQDCSQVQRLASIYRLRSCSASQGSGKKRFVTVMRTEHTCMPSSSDRFRLDKVLGAGNEEATFTVNDITSRKTASIKTKKVPKGTSGLSPLDSKSAKSKTKRRDKDKTGSYAAQPVSFISSGNMVSENPTDQTLNDNKPVSCSSSYGAFELHTTGFGSRMMAKMGYVDGGGLGKDGRGIAEPIEVTQRPKSLGLGAKIPETSNTSEPMNSTPPQRLNRPVGQSSKGSGSKGKSGNVQFGSFEKHTKGFGSKMMAKMGFVEGMGLGRDSQGMVNPLVASRLPKSRGLGAKG